MDTQSSDPPPPEDRQGWLRRQLAPIFARRPRGDVVAASVGEGARGVAVGKYIIQIGTLVVPAYAVAAVIAVVLVSLGVAILRQPTVAETPGPVKMAGPFNVAVADFGQETADGKAQRSAQGDQLSQWVYGALEDERNQHPDPSSVWIWNDSMPRSAKGVDIGYIAGDTPEARAGAAAAKAEELGSQLLIYGNLDRQSRFIPEFYVAPVRGSGTNFQGHFQFGTDPIRVGGMDSVTVNDELKARSRALFWLAKGLRYDQSGQPDQALQAFEQARSVPGNWQGKELVDFFIGQAALFQFATQPGQSSHADAQAEDAFKQALALKPGYAGALIGLGGVALVRAQNLQPARLRLETTDLQQALDSYNQAVRAAPNSPDRDWAQYAAPVALGMAYRVQGDAYLDAGNLAAAGPAFDQAIGEIEANLGAMRAAKEYRLLGQAYEALGTAHAEKGILLSRQGDKSGSKNEYQAAHNAFTGCEEQGSRAPADELLTKAVIAGQCRPYDSQVGGLEAALGTP